MTVRPGHGKTASLRGAAAIEHRSTSGGLRTFVLLAALFTFLWQSFVVETHLHAHLAAVSVTTASHNIQKQADVGNNPAAPKLPVNCPLCQELAQSGAYLVPAAVLFASPPIIEVTAPMVSVLHSAPDGRSHAWQSRAPPVPFET